MLRSLLATCMHLLSLTNIPVALSLPHLPALTQLPPSDQMMTCTVVCASRLRGEREGAYSVHSLSQPLTDRLSRRFSFHPWKNHSNKLSASLGVGRREKQIRKDWKTRRRRSETNSVVHYRILFRGRISLISLPTLIEKFTALGWKKELFLRENNNEVERRVDWKVLRIHKKIGKNQRKKFLPFNLKTLMKESLKLQKSCKLVDNQKRLLNERI